jgi:hypothetical protein
VQSGLRPGAPRTNQDNLDCRGAHSAAGMGHKRAATAGILLRRRKGKGSVMTRIHWVKRGAQGWSDGARAIPWWDIGLRHSPGAALACVRPAARVKAGGCVPVSRAVDSALELRKLITGVGGGMREVEIIEEDSSQRRWVAIDMRTRKPVLRLHDRNLLWNICRGLDWKIVPTNPQRVQDSSSG